MASDCSGGLTILRNYADGSGMFDLQLKKRAPDSCLLVIIGQYTLDWVSGVDSRYHIRDLKLYTNFAGADLMGPGVGDFQWVYRHPRVYRFRYAVPLFPTRFRVDVGVVVEFRNLQSGQRFVRRHDFSMEPLRPDRMGLFHPTASDQVEWSF